MNHTLAEIYNSLLIGKSLPTIGIATQDILETSLIHDWRAKLEQQGVQHGDRLLILAEPCTNTIALLFAAWSKGAVVIPLPPVTSQKNLALIAEDCHASYVIQPAADNWEKADRISTSKTSTPKTSIKYRKSPKVTGADLALIIYTSGSTGSPKGIMLTHTNVLSALRSISEYLALKTDDIILSVPPLHFDYGLYQILFACFTQCTAYVAPASTNPMQALQMVKEYRPTILPLVPALAVGMVRLAKAMKLTFPSVRLITNTGGHLPVNTIQALTLVFPNAQIMPMYGLTESKRVMFNTPEFVEKYPESSGKPMPGIEAKVFVEHINEQGSEYVEADVDEVGELWVRGTSVMQGYTTDKSGAGCRLIQGNYRDDNWLATGDLFSVNEDGFFFFRGRQKELIKQAGFCLYPRDIEASIESIDFIEDCAVVGSEDENGDEIACLFVRSEKLVSKQELSTFLKELLDSAYIPKRIEIVEQWPLSVNGKVDKKQLKSLLVQEQGA